MYHVCVTAAEIGYPPHPSLRVCRAPSRDQKIKNIKLVHSPHATLVLFINAAQPLRILVERCRLALSNTCQDCDLPGDQNRRKSRVTWPRTNLTAQSSQGTTGRSNYSRCYSYRCSNQTLGINHPPIASPSPILLAHLVPAQHMAAIPLSWLLKNALDHFASPRRQH